MTRPQVQQRPLEFATEGRDVSRWWAQSGRKDWRTTEEELVLVRRVFGSLAGPGVIDLDPCSNPWSRTRARLECMLERGQNGLSVPWRGKTFSNPPYGVGEIELFTARARTEAQLVMPPFCHHARLHGEAAAVDGHETVLLVPANTETRWYHRDCAVADALCFRKGRIQFDQPPWIDGDADWMADARRLALAGCIDELRSLLDATPGAWESRSPEAEDKESSSTVANLFVYWGPRPDWFVEVYEDQGHAFVTTAGRERS